jgi:chromosomal replication initiator protein
LFIYGKTGLGKTHLVQAVGNYLVNKYRKIKVAYTTGERFYLDYLNALQNNKVSDFTMYYRSADVLIVDDIHSFSGKEKTQDHFFHTFNHLHQNGKQIILTSDRHQKDIKDVDDRLISRFQWGLTADIQAPDFEMRVALLRKKSADEGLELSQEIIEYIARNVTKHVRELEGVLISLFARVTMDRKPLTLQLVKELIEGSRSLEPRLITIEAIKQEVSNYYNIPIDLMESALRKHEVALARQMSMYMAKHFTQLSLKSIGSHFGNRDHSTVLHSCQAIENYFITDRNVKSAYEHILKRIKREI